MKRALACALVLAFYCLVQSGVSYAANIACLDPDETQKEFPNFCISAGLTGEITPGDSEHLVVFLLKYDKMPALYLNSPGGDFLEGLRIGRVLRRHLIEVRARDISTIGDLHAPRQCGGEDTPVCCASACALAYFGGANWTPYDKLGLHRATPNDTQARSLSEVKAIFKGFSRIARDYFEDMDVDIAAFDAMMTAPPDGINIYTVGESFLPDLQQGVYNIFPASIRDWLSSMCKGSTGDHQKCLATKFKEAQLVVKDSETDPPLERIDPIEIADEIRLIHRELEAAGHKAKTLLESPIPYLYNKRLRYQLDRLDELRLNQESVKISKMDACDAVAYLKTHAESDDSSNLGERRVSKNIIERLTKLTGSGDYWDERNQHPKGCAE
jgi:hypothetical protein